MPPYPNIEWKCNGHKVYVVQINGFELGGMDLINLTMNEFFRLHNILIMDLL